MDDRAWLEALSRLTPVPARYARPTVTPDEAARFLRCPTATVAALSDHGLPHYQLGFDQFDLINLALRARPGSSIPEISLGLLLRFITQDPSAWSSPMSWKFTVNGICGSARSNGSESGQLTHTPRRRWVLWAPTEASDMTLKPSSDGSILADGADISFTCTVRTDGLPGRIESPEIRAVVRQIIDARYTFTRMPDVVQRDAQWMQDHRIFDCVSISAELERRFEARGLSCRTRYGWLGALAASGHAWIEVLDDDGYWKPIDLALRALAEILYPNHPIFQEFCLGSRLNRLIPTGCPIDQPLISHDCDIADDGEYVVAIQQLDR